MSVPNSLFTHTEGSFQNQSLPRAQLPTLPAPQLEKHIAVCFRRTIDRQCGPGLSTSRDLPAHVGPETVPPGKKVEVKDPGEGRSRGDALQVEQVRGCPPVSPDALGLALRVH